MCLTVSGLSQIPEGKLFIYTQKTSPNDKDLLACIEYPSVQYSVIDSTTLTDFLIYNNMIYIANDNIYVYNVNSFQKEDSILNTTVNQLVLWNNKLVFSSIAPPHFRVCNIDSTYNIAFVIDTPIIKAMPMDFIISGDWAILAIDTNLVIVDMLIHDTLAVVGIDAPLKWAGYGSRLIEANNVVFVDLEYYTGAPRFSFVRLDKLNFKTDSVFHVEMNMNVYKPQAVNERIYLTEYPSYYDTNTDSLFLYGFYSPFAIEHDSSTGCIFVYNDINCEILCYDDTVAISNIAIQGHFKKALWHPQITSSIFSNDHNNGFNIYPLPCKDQLKIDFPEKIFLWYISIYNVNGQQVYYETLKDKYSSLVVNFSNYKTGIYFITIATGEGKYSKKIFKIE